MLNLLPRILMFTLLWWVITEGAGGWALGLPVIALAVGSSYLLQPRRQLHLRPLGVLRFTGFFLVQSLRAGLDVALRALRPHMQLAPALLEYRLQLPAGPARVFLADTMSLLPGTLSTELRGDCLCLHVLDARQSIEADLRHVEVRVADLFGLTLQD
ncbi:MAG TPA: Na+/H+ antiporter subunit E [Gammaproteobacteria bacterium]|nr:Na+/H+ antiporter subunit E [Gammaproteobacteria bacterium]